MVTNIFACGGIATAQACSRPGDEAQISVDPNLPGEGQGVPPIASVAIAETPVAPPIAVQAIPEQARCSAGQLQDGTAKACVYPVDASVAQRASLGNVTSCCPPLSSRSDELPRCWPDSTASTVAGSLSQACVFAAKGVVRARAEADPNQVCCPQGLSLIDENSSCEPTHGAAVLVGCLFPKAGAPAQEAGVNVCCPPGDSLADGAAATATLDASSASLTGERPTCTAGDMLSISGKVLGKPILAGCFAPRDASVPKVDASQGATNFCCPPGDSTATTIGPASGEP